MNQNFYQFFNQNAFSAVYNACLYTPDETKAISFFTCLFAEDKLKQEYSILKL